MMLLDPSSGKHLVHSASDLTAFLEWEALTALNLQALSDLTLAAQRVLPDPVAERVRLVQAGKRKMPMNCFETVAHATLKRQRLKIVHHNRERDDRVEREISPLQLVQYRDNWYVDAVCHLRRGIRCFGIDAIESAEVLDTPADEVDIATLRKALGASYGIFGGDPKGWARIRFSPKRALWVEHEEWHPLQRKTMLKDGSLELEFPYSDEREVLADVLSFGPDARVMAPPDLKKQYKQLVAQMAR